jgi:hypothetical protein
MGDARESQSAEARETRLYPAERASGIEPNEILLAKEIV